MRKAKQEAIDDMMEQARELGANAVVGVDLDYETIQIQDGGSMLMVSASGTAVVFGVTRRQMHPALSVIFFTTLSGAGYGLLFWAALACADRRRCAARTLLVAIALALVLSTIGLLSSLLHLGKPHARVARVLAMAHVVAVARRRGGDGDVRAGAALLAAALLPALIAGDAQGRRSRFGALGEARRAALADARRRWRPSTAPR